MRRAAVSILFAGALASPMAAVARMPSPEAVADVQAWHVADCEVIAAAVAEVEPALFWKRQTLAYKEHFDGDETRSLAGLIPSHLPRGYGFTGCPEIATPVAVEDNARFHRPVWSADYSRVLLQIQLTPLSSQADLYTAQGRWRFFLLERDGVGWRVVQRQDVTSWFWPTEVEEIT